MTGRPTSRPRRRSSRPSSTPLAASAGCRGSTSGSLEAGPDEGHLRPPLMIARARIIAEADGSGATRLPVLRSSVPLVLRQAEDAVWIVGGAAGPLGGDDLGLDIDVGPGAALTVRTAAAAV